MSRYALGDWVVVNRITPTKRDTPTGVVTRLPVGASPYYVVRVEGEDLHLPLDEILGEVPPVNPSPAEMVSWLRS